MAKVSSTTKTINVVGYILAGGESRRFQHQIKGMIRLNEKPLVQHVIERFRPQVDHLNINSHFIEYAQFGFPTVGEMNTFLGPLSGLFHCMKHMHDYYPEVEWLSIVPCDAPFLPDNMIELLSTNTNQYLAQCFRYAEQLQPVFSIWHKDLLKELDIAVNQHQWGGLKIFLQSLDNAVNVVEYPEQTVSPFFNINSEKDLVQATQIIGTLRPDYE